MRVLIALAALAACACGPASQAGVPEYGYEVVHLFPHDRAAFTEGLFYLNGFLYESTGLDMGRSWVRKVKLETGEVLQQHQLAGEYFGEGIVKWQDKLYQLTYKNQVGFIYDLIPDHVRVLTEHELRASSSDSVSGPKDLGDRWIESLATAVLEVPSVVVPLERNYLLNPGHPEFGEILVEPSVPFVFDGRLFK